MHGASFFHQAFIYLAATVVAVPLAKRLGFGSVLGYLIAGVLIGPYALGLVGEEGKDVMHFAEFGVVMMLFVVGLELEPSLLFRLRGPILGLGGAQVGGTALIASLVALAFGLKWQISLAIGLILALSSTAIVLQTLQEKGLMKTHAGQSAFAVLLFQDLAVIPMLALMPLLATAQSTKAAGASGHEANLISDLSGWASALVVLGVMTALVLSGRFILAPLFRYIAKARLRETFTAAALFIVIGIALLMTKIGLSPALGTFVAGVVLATSEYKHELEANIEPFKGLLLGLFFIAVGASIDFGMVENHPGLIGSLVSGLMIFKFGVLFSLARLFGIGRGQNFLFSFALAQGGEFAFVLFSFATEHGVIPHDVASPLVASVAISMALTPLAFVINERLIQPRLITSAPVRPQDEVHEDHPVIVAGYGRFGQVVARLLHSAGYDCTLLDVNSDQVDMVRQFGARVYYGDASRMDLLRSAGAEKAKLLIVAVDNHEKALEIAREARRHFPHLHILARARGRTEAFDFHDIGVLHVFRETFDSSLRMGTRALETLGEETSRAEHIARAFCKHDEDFLQETARRRRETADTWITFARNRSAELIRVLRNEYAMKRQPSHTDAPQGDDETERPEVGPPHTERESSST